MEVSDRTPPSPLRDVCTRYGITFKKALGQNLMLDDNINRIMAEAAELSPEDGVVEVGAGLGTLTRHLAARAGRVLAVEIDASFMPCLEDQFRDVPQVALFRGDILNHGLRDLTETHLAGSARLKMVSNLPYYVTTPVLFHFLEAPVFFSEMVVMLQWEVGERLLAEVNKEGYGVLTIAARSRAEVTIVHRVPASCFVPRPQVDSCIVRFRFHPVDRGKALFLTKVARAAFAHRRKTLHNSLIKSGAFGAPRDAVQAAFSAAGIDAGRRPQTLTLEEFSRLAGAIQARL